MTTENKDTETKSETAEQQAATSARPENDTKTLVAPLAMYAVVALGIVSVIVLTAVKLNSELNDIDKQYAEVESVFEQDTAQLPADEAQAGTTAETLAAVETSEDTAAETEVSTNTDTPTSSDDADTGVAVNETEAEQAVSVAEVAPEADVATVSDDIQQQTETAPAITADEAQEIVADAAPVIEAPAQVDAAISPSDQRRDEMRAEMRQQMEQHFSEMKQRDSERLAEMKQRDDEQLNRIKDAMDQRIADLQQRITELEQRNVEFYELRRSAMEERQARQVEILNRI